MTFSSGETDNPLPRALALQLHLDRSNVPRRRSVHDRFDVVSVWIEQECREIAWMIIALTGRAIITPAGFEARFVEALHGVGIVRLKRKVHTARPRVVSDIDPQFIEADRFIALVRRLAPECAEHRAIEALRPSQIRHPKVDVIDQPPTVINLRHAFELERRTPKSS